MLTFNEWFEHHCPINRPYNRDDLKAGFEGAMRELMVKHWEFRVVLPDGYETDAGGTWFSENRRSDWHVLPFVCIKPMLQLYGDEIELRPVYVTRGLVEKGSDVLARLNVNSAVPF